MDRNYIGEQPLGYGQFNTGSVDIALPVGNCLLGGVIPAGCVLLLIRPTVQAIRYRDDGIAPTTTTGYLIPAGVEFRCTTRAFSQAQIISATAGAEVDVLAYGHN